MRVAGFRVTLRIEDYAMIGDCETAALVGRNGSIDWLCAPRFDSGACFAALVGTEEHGRWLIAPKEQVRSSRRQYRDGSMVLETEIETSSGAVRLIDFMPQRDGDPRIVRIVEGLRGRVDMAMELRMRFDYGSVVPWVRDTNFGLLAVAGPDALLLSTPIRLTGEDMHTVGEFTVGEKERVPFVLGWQSSNAPLRALGDADALLQETERWWAEWCGKCTYEGPWKHEVLRSLITLKALTYAPTGGIVAAPTTSLPELVGGARNWDYRFCWLRDATFTLYALLLAGYTTEASAWRDWILRAVAGSPSQMQIMYGLAGERRLTETEVDWLPGYEGSKPVRVGNDAHQQTQLDVYGELMDSFHIARGAGLEPEKHAWEVQKIVMDFLESAWHNPDEGIWEVRGPRRHFTHSKVMAWVAFDRAVKAVERSGLDGPVDRWRALRDDIHRQVCEQGFDQSLNAFVQSFGSKDLDASLLMVPLVGFLPANDPRVVGTVKAIQERLMEHGFVRRYTPHAEVDGMTGSEGSFLVCTFWLADNLALQGRRAEASELFQRVLDVANDVGLLAEQYDPVAKRQLGNFPQALSHVGLINTASNLERGGPAEQRSSN